MLLGLLPRILDGLAAALAGGEAGFFIAADAFVRVQSFQDELARGGTHRIRFTRAQAEQFGFREQTLNSAELFHHMPGGDALVEFQRAAQFEPLDDLRHVLALKILGEHLADGQANQFARHGVATLELALIFKLDLAGDGGKRGIDVKHARHRHRFARHHRAAFGVGAHVFERRNRQPLTDAGTLVDALVISSRKRNLLDHFADVIGDVQLGRRLAIGPGFLPCDVDAVLDGRGIVGANFAADAVLERRDDLAARGVIFRVGGEHHHEVKRQADGVAFNLDVALLHDVEQAHLNFAGQVGQFVDGEDAAVGARQQAVVNGQLAADGFAGARGFNGIDVADHVGDGHVGRRQLFDVARLAREPRNRRRVAFLRDQVAARLADGGERMIVNFAAGDVRHVVVEQRHQHADQARFRLPAEAEQNKVVLRQHRVDHLRSHRILIAHDAGKQGFVSFEFRDEVLAQFSLYAADGVFLTGTKSAKGIGKAGRKSHEAEGPNRIVAIRRRASACPIAWSGQYNVQPLVERPAEQRLNLLTESFGMRGGVVRFEIGARLPDLHEGEVIQARRLAQQFEPNRAFVFAAVGGELGEQLGAFDGEGGASEIDVRHHIELLAGFLCPKRHEESNAKDHREYARHRQPSYPLPR